MTRRIGPALALLALALVLSAACGIDRFDAKGWAGLAAADGVLYVTSGEGRVYALDITGDAEGAVGRPSLLYPPYPRDSDDGLGPVYAPPVLGAALGASTLFVATYEDPEEDDDVTANLFGVDAATGVRSWSASVPGRVVGAPSVQDGRLVVGTTAGSLHALQVSDQGGRPWQPFAADGKIWASAAIAEGVAYFGTLGHTVYAVNMRDGSERWQTPLGGAVAGAPLLIDGLVIVGALDRTLYALNAATGAEVWRFEGDGWFWASPVAHDGVIYAATLGGAVYAIGRDGGARWTTPAEAGGPIVAAPVFVDGALIAATTEKQVHQFDALDGSELWNIGVGEPIRAELAVEGEVVYLIDTDGVVHALHAGQRRELWTYPTKN